MNIQSLQSRFDDALRALPAPGTGCHAALLGAANYGVLAGLSDADIMAAMRSAIPPGARQVPDKELQDAIDKARRDRQAAPVWTGRVTPRAGQSAPARPPLPMDAEAVAARQSRLIEAGGGAFDPLADPARAAEGSSPAWPGWALTAPAGDAVVFLRELFDDGDLLYIGPRDAGRELQPKFIRPASEWIEFFRARLADGTDPVELGRCFPYIAVNPVTGQAAESGSFRCDAAVAAFRHIVIEHDALPLNQQIPLIRGLGLPVVAMVHTGGKSIHALIDLASYCGETITTLERWREVVGGLFECLRPYRFDLTTRNPSRLTRLPGVARPPAATAAPSVPLPSIGDPPDAPDAPDAPEPLKWQRLLYVSGRRARA